jgi:hypothetical protein
MSPLIIGLIVVAILAIVVVVIYLIPPTLPENFPASYIVSNSEGKIISKDDLKALRTSKFTLPFIPNTVSAWVKLDPSYVATNRAGVIIGNNDGVRTIMNPFNFELHTDSRPRYYKNTIISGTTRAVLDSTFRPTAPVIQNDVWTNVTVVRDVPNKKVLLYLNGEQKGVNDYTNDVNASTFFNDTITLTDYIIGNDLRQGDGLPLNGSLSTVRVFGSALTSDEIKKLYEVDRYNLKKIAPTTDMFDQLPAPPVAQYIYHNNLYRIMTSRLNLKP